MSEDAELAPLGPEAGRRPGKARREIDRLRARLTATEAELDDVRSAHNNLVDQAQVQGVNDGNRLTARVAAARAEGREQAARRLTQAALFSSDPDANYWFKRCAEMVRTMTDPAP